MLTLNTQQKFIYQEVNILAWGASVQRAHLYASDIQRDIFRKKILTYIENDILSQYSTKCEDDVHVENIESIVEYGTTTGGSLLGPNGYKFGVAQKFLNLLLKYLWCLGHVVEPPHCPVDRIVLTETTLRDKLNWTEITTADKYMQAITALRDVAEAAGFSSLAQWELQFYSRRRA